jgi:maltose O-acetyltransferase
MNARTEREKVLAGEPYIASDPELVAAHRRAVRLLRAYNVTLGEEFEQRAELLEELLGAKGEGIYIEPPFFCY